MRSFEVIAQDGFARRGRLSLAHGVVHTPAFMPVGTYGAVKTLSPLDLKALGTEMILANTYHLYLRPGLEVISCFEGLHRFMQWKSPILTDSGGFQIFSLGNLKNVSDEGVTFRSHLNGDLYEFSPELSAKIQAIIGADIAMVLDECVPLPNTHTALHSAVTRSLLWARRFLTVPRPPHQLVFGIVQGGTDFALRESSLLSTLQLPVDGIAVGGLSVGEGHSQMIEVLTFLAKSLPPDLPHYLMGVGTPRDLLESIHLGLDLFDCVLPTRNARNGGFFTPHGMINIRNQQYRLDPSPIDKNCLCECCRHYSRAYLRHLFQTKEILGCRLATIHNLYYYHHFMLQIRTHLEKRNFESFYKKLSPELRIAYPSEGRIENGGIHVEEK